MPTNQSLDGYRESKGNHFVAKIKGNLKSNERRRLLWDPMF